MSVVSFKAVYYGVKDQIRWTYEDVFLTDESECRLEKGLFGLFCGLLLGAATFLAFRYALEFSFTASAVIGVVAGLILAVALGYNTYMRAVVCLCMPTLTLKSGRLVLSTIIFSLLLAGPITNFSNNASELATTYACSGELLHNQSLAVQRRVEEPFIRFWKELQKKVETIDRKLTPVKKTWNGLSNFIQKIGFGLFPKIRDGLNKVSEKLTFAYDVENDINTTVDAIPSREEIVQGIKEDIESKIEVIDKVLLYVNRAISLSVLIIVIQSALYLNKYKQVNVDFNDNQYITELFVQVDEQRKSEGKPSLLPLAPAEKELVTDKRQKKMSVLEQKALRACLIPVLITVLGGVGIILGDTMLYHSLMFIREHSNYRVAVNDEGDVKVVKMEGNHTEILADLINHNAIDTARCLPNGSPPNTDYTIGICMAYLVLIFMVVFQAYMLRLRRLIASYFYPQAEEHKVKALHKKLSQERDLTVWRIQDDLVAKKQRKAKKASSKASVIAIKTRAAKIKSSKWWLIRKKCFICQSKETDVNKHNKCDSCSQRICEECMETLIKTSACPCSEERRLPYDEVTDSDFEGLMREHPITSETHV